MYILIVVLYTGCFRKKAQSFTHDKFGTVRRIMSTFVTKCSAEITVILVHVIVINGLNALF